jgi:hypothetical protein
MWCISKIEFSRSKRIPEEHWRLVLNAFVNASEGQQDNTIVAMGSFVANEAHWKKFENRWKAFLTGNGIKWRFNASEFLAHRDQFNWHHEKHDRVTKEIAQIFNEVGMCGFGVAVDCKAYHEWRLKQKVTIPHDPYYWCLQRMMRPLILSIYEVPKDEGVAIYVDRDNARPNLSVEQWYSDQVRAGSEARIARKVSIHHVSSSEYVGLQAADIASNGAYRYLSHFVKTGEWKVPPIISGFKMFFGPVQCAAVSDTRFRYDGVCGFDGVFWCYCDTDDKIAYEER